MNKLDIKREQNRIWRLKNREYLLSVKNMDYQENKEKYKQYRKTYLLNHRFDKEFREKSRNDSKRRRYIQRMRMFNLLGYKCIKCGFSDIRALQFDHINSDGSIERKELKANKFLRYYINHPQEAKEKLQVLCANCNHIKRIEKNEHRKPIYQNLINIVRNPINKKIKNETLQINSIISLSEKAFWHKLSKIIMNERKTNLELSYEG